MTSNENNNARQEDDGVNKQWTLEELLESSAVHSPSRKNKKDKAMDWGRPGHLTKEELDVYVSNIINKRFDFENDESFLHFIVHI
jgi:hypothetical protein